MMQTLAVEPEDYASAETEGMFVTSCWVTQVHSVISLTWADMEVEKLLFILDLAPFHCSVSHGYGTD